MPASATRALVSSSGDTLPAATRLAAARVAICASPTESCARRRRSCAVSTAKTAVTAAARSSARRADSADAAWSRARSAAVTRAARLPPSSRGWLSCSVVVRLLRRRSSSCVSSVGLGQAPACTTAPSAAACSWRAADRPGLACSASATAARRVSGPSGSSVRAGADRDDEGPAACGVCCEKAGGTAKANTASGTKSVRIEFSWVAKQRTDEFGEERSADE
ncbi:hypothetical protein D3C72_1617420 [compost metagenome]